MNFTIGLDLDGVCYNWQKTARYMLRNRLAEQGKHQPNELFVDFQSWNCLDGVIDKEDLDWLWTDGVKKGLFRYGHVVKGAIEGVQELSKLGDIIVITSRPKSAVHDTMVWLSTMLNQVPLAGVVIQSHGQKKSDVVPQPDVYIDDGLHNIKDILLNAGSQAILFDQPWNQDSFYDTIRAYGWGATIQMVKKIRENS